MEKETIVIETSEKTKETGYLYTVYVLVAPDDICAFVSSESEDVGECIVELETEMRGHTEIGKMILSDIMKERHKEEQYKEEELKKQKKEEEI